MRLKFDFMKMMLKFFIGMVIFKVAEGILWEDGYYDSGGSWSAWESSWATWENGTEWLTWNEMVLNSTTKLWERWPDGQYFDTPRDTCQNWGTSWVDKCAYQSHWFQCTGTQAFSLSQLKCVTSWSSTQLLIEDAQVQGLRVCRDFNYYVNPNSTELVELGTKKYPYKNIGLAFLEILNFWAHSSSNLTIYVMENTIVNIEQGYNFIINITSVTISSYSATSSSPAKSTLYVRQYALEKFNSNTIFTLLASSTLQLSSKISSIPSREKLLLSSTDTTIFAYASSFALNNLRLQGDLENDVLSGSFFLRPIYLQEKYFTMTNVDVQLTGMMLRSFDPMSFYLENVYIDFHAMMGGFHMNIE